MAEPKSIVTGARASDSVPWSLARERLFLRHNYFLRHAARWLIFLSVINISYTRVLYTCGSIMIHRALLAIFAFFNFPCPMPHSAFACNHNKSGARRDGLLIIVYRR